MGYEGEELKQFTAEERKRIDEEKKQACERDRELAEEKRQAFELEKLTRSSADADNRLDAFSGQSRSTNMVPFHM